MLEQKHTPTPYHRNIKPANKYTTIWAGRNEHIAYIATQGRNPEQVEVDMDFIVRACNAHDDLVDAGEDALEQMEQCENMFRGDTDFMAALDKLKSALARAKAVQ